MNPTVWNNGITSYVEIQHPDEHVIYRAVKWPCGPEGVLRLHFLDIRTFGKRIESYAKHRSVWVELLPEDGGPKVYNSGTPEYEAFEALLTHPAFDTREYCRQVLRAEGVLQ
ncbi:MAG: hypothetical protein HY513_04190 [Candidatus Aenigmarchaeota archaeon]|nr:hypothetical protein [Candidatus Aenigmarchaeota archaeon]